MGSIIKEKQANRSLRSLSAQERLNPTKKSTTKKKQQNDKKFKVASKV